MASNQDCGSHVVFDPRSVRQFPARNRTPSPLATGSRHDSQLHPSSILSEARVCRLLCALATGCSQSVVPRVGSRWYIGNERAVRVRSSAPSMRATIDTFEVAFRRPRHLRRLCRGRRRVLSTSHRRKQHAAIRYSNLGFEQQSAACETVPWATTAMAVAVVRKRDETRRRTNDIDVSRLGCAEPAGFDSIRFVSGRQASSQACYYIRSPTSDLNSTRQSSQLPHHLETLNFSTVLFVWREGVVVKASQVGSSRPRQPPATLTESVSRWQTESWCADCGEASCQSAAVHLYRAVC